MRLGTVGSGGNCALAGGCGDAGSVAIGAGGRSTAFAAVSDVGASVPGEDDGYSMTAAATTKAARPPISTQGGLLADLGAGVEPICRRVFFEAIWPFYIKPIVAPRDVYCPFFQADLWFPCVPVSSCSLKSRSQADRPITTSRKP